MYENIVQDDDPLVQSESSIWGLGGEHHTESISEEEYQGFSQALAEARSYVPGVEDLLNEAQDTARTLQIEGYECQVCPLHHPHPENKHDIVRDLGVNQDFADNMWAQQNCHCAVHELEMLMNFVDDFGVDIFDDIDNEELFVSGESLDRVSEVQTAQDAADVPNEVTEQVADLRDEMEGLVS
jgi:hypothetical protein